MRAGRQLVSRAEGRSTGLTRARLEPFPVNVRVKIAALWASMLFVFAYVDLFSLYRPDFRADVEAGEVGGFAVNQTFLLATTAYVVIPSLMVFCVLVLRPRLNRIVNIALAMVYAVSIVAATIGDLAPDDRPLVGRLALADPPLEAVPVDARAGGCLRLALLGRPGAAGVAEDLELDEAIDVLDRQAGLVELHPELLHAVRGDGDHAPNVVDPQVSVNRGFFVYLRTERYAPG